MVMHRTAIARGLDLAILGLSSFVLGYGLLKASGLFAPASMSMIKALHGTPPQAALALLLATLLARAVLGDASPGRRELLILRAGLLLMACGLVASSYVRFEGAIVITEGQLFTGNAQEYVEGSLYRGKKASLPQFGLETREVSAHRSKNGSVIGPFSLNAVYGSPSGPPREITISSGLPWTDRDLFLRITRFGYSPLFRFTDERGNVLQEFFSPMAVFPAGTEDSLRTLWIPHVFYVKYYPEGADEGGAHGGASGPLFKLRIARNIDLLFDGNVRLNEPVRFEIMSIAFPEVRKWVEITVVRDYGMLVFSAGCLISASAIISLYFRARSRRGGAHVRPGGQEP